MTATTNTRNSRNNAPATEKQLNFIHTLRTERDLTDESENGFAARIVIDVFDGLPIEDVTVSVASGIISHLLALPRREARPTGNGASANGRDAEEAPEGMHKLNGVILKVQRAVNGSGRLYAKKLIVTKRCPGHLADGPSAFDAPLVYCHDTDDCHLAVTDAHFDYAPGAIRQLSAETRMSLEEAKEFGALYGTCCACGRTLTDEESIEAGIGPVCAQKF